MTGLLRAPLLHFFVLGAVLFAFDRAPGEVREPGGAASDASLSDEDLLVREARTLQLHRSDPLVRRRLVRNMRFLDAAPERSDADLFEQALELGMDRSDPVVRRRLAQRITLGIEAGVRSEEPDDRALEEYRTRHAERFTEPERIRISQVFLSRDRRGDALASDARALRERLIADAIPPGRAAGFGDPLLLGSNLPLRSISELDRSFGAGFADRIAGAIPGAWLGPVESSYGLHLVWVHERRPAQVSPLGTVRAAVRESILAERAEAALRDALASLRSG